MSDEFGKSFLRMFSSVHLAILGRQKILQLKDIGFVLENKQELTSHKQLIQVCEKRLSDTMIGTFALALALVMSLQRYFPDLAVLSKKKIIIETILGCSIVAIGANTAIMSVDHMIRQIKRSMVMSYLPLYLSHMDEIQEIYKISPKQQLLAVLKSEDEFENWKKGRDSLSQKVV